MNNYNWKSKTTGYNRHIETYNRDFLPDESESSAGSDDVEEYEIKVIKKNTHREIVNEFNKLKQAGMFAGRTRGPKESKNINNGLYYSNYKGSARLLTKNELIHGIVDYGLNREHVQHYKYYAVYENINDKDSVEFWLIYYDKKRRLTIDI